MAGATFRGQPITVRQESDTVDDHVWWMTYAADQRILRMRHSAKGCLYQLVFADANGHHNVIFDGSYKVASFESLEEHKLSREEVVDFVFITILVSLANTIMYGISASEYHQVHGALIRVINKYAPGFIKLRTIIDTIYHESTVDAVYEA